MGKRTRMLIYSLSAVGVLVILSIIFTYRLRELGALSWGDFIIGVATIVLAFATYFLGYSGLADGALDRKQAIELAEMDRRRLRLKEQLEGLYSPLMSHIYILESIDQHHLEPIYSLMLDIRGKYEFLAEEDLKDLFREYYDTELHSISKDEWEKLIYPMMDAIGIGCVNISIEYDDLTRKVT